MKSKINNTYPTLIRYAIKILHIDDYISFSFRTSLKVVIFFTLGVEMCITSSFKKFRTEYCNTSKTFFNSSTVINRLHYDFCIQDHKGSSSQWYTPELDIYNQHHIVIYKSNDSDNDSEINYAESDFPNTIWIVSPSTEIIIKTSVFVPLVLWGIFANFSLLYIITKYKHLRTPTNMVIANMATVDLASLVIYPWVFLICDFFQNYQFGEFGCRVDGWLEFSMLLINMMNLSTITYDRLTAIVLPQETRLTRRGAKIVIIVSWFSSLIIASPLIIFREYKKRQWMNFLEIYCTEDATFLAIYWHILLVMAVWLPLAIMLIFYTAIFIKLDRYEQKVLKREHPLSVCYKTKVAKIVFIVVITFVICRMPFTVLIFRRNQWLKTNKQDQILGPNQILWFVARYLIYANAALDPLLYGLTNENFRRAFRATPIIKFLFPNKKKIPVPKKICVNIIQPRSPYKEENKSDNCLILKSKNSTECSKEKSGGSSPQTDIKNLMLT